MIEFLVQVSVFSMQFLFGFMAVLLCLFSVFGLSTFDKKATFEERRAAFGLIIQAIQAAALLATAVVVMGWTPA